MKRTFLFLVILITGYYGYEACILYNKLAPLTQAENGKLTEFAQRVIPIALDTAGGPSIENPRKFIRQQGNLYFISENILYHFSENGEYISQITTPENMLVADYLVDTHNSQLIVLGNEDDVFYYTLEGELKNKRKFPTDQEYSRLRSITYHRNRLWIVKERVTNGKDIEKVVVEYDTTLVPLNAYPLEMATTCHKPQLFTCMNPQFGVIPETDELYIYNSPDKPDYLVRDTLNVRQQRWISPSIRNNTVQVYPFRIGSRFYLSSWNIPADNTVCFYGFDDKNNKAWTLKEGIKDDIYQTGYIQTLQPMDLMGDNYCYVKKGKDLTTGFPEIANRNIPVVFIVQMKS